MRYPNWEQRLSEYLKAQEQAPFVWGVNDCAHFAAGAAKAITGVGFGECYPCDSALSAARMIKQSGGLLAIADNHYRRVPVTFAQRGDAVAADVSGDGLSLGVCRGMDAVFKTADSLLIVPMSVIYAAWRVE